MTVEWIRLVYIVVQTVACKNKLLVFDAHRCHISLFIFAVFSECICTNCIKHGPKHQKAFWVIKCPTFSDFLKSVLYLFAQPPPTPFALRCAATVVSQVDLLCATPLKKLHDPLPKKNYLAHCITWQPQQSNNLVPSSEQTPTYNNHRVMTIMGNHFKISGQKVTQCFSKITVTNKLSF